MAIKRRTPGATREQAIAEFAEGAATTGTQDSTATTQSVATAPRERVSTPRQGSGANTPRTMLLRFPDDEIPQLLQDLADRDERSKHNMALRALRIGLDTIANQ